VAASDGAAGGARFDVRDLNEGRRAPVVYSEKDGERHPDKGDKIVGAVLLGYFIYWVIATVHSGP
jgi:hypothetical protein